MDFITLNKKLHEFLQTPDKYTVMQRELELNSPESRYNLNKSLLSRKAIMRIDYAHRLGIISEQEASELFCTFISTPVNQRDNL